MSPSLRMSKQNTLLYLSICLMCLCFRLAGDLGRNLPLLTAYNPDNGYCNCTSGSLSFIAHSFMFDDIGVQMHAFYMIDSQPIEIESIPYQAIIQKTYIFACGGTIISPKFVLSAAHCIPEMDMDDNGVKTDVEPYEARIQTGTNIANEGGVFYDVAKILRHPSFPTEENAPSLDCDIALFMIKDTFKFNNFTQPIKLAYKEPTSSDKAFVSGYGSRERVAARFLLRGSRSEQYIEQINSLLRKEVQDLRGSFFPIVKRTECIQKHKKYNDSVITQNMICAGYPKGFKDACSGDSGGPLTVDNRLAGIVSWGQGCGTEGVPGIYTNVVKFLKWIDINMKAMEGTTKRMDGGLRLV